MNHIFCSEFRHLIEENIFPVSCVHVNIISYQPVLGNSHEGLEFRTHDSKTAYVARENVIFKNLSDSMLGAQLLPKFITDCKNS